MAVSHQGSRSQTKHWWTCEQNKFSVKTFFLLFRSFLDINQNKRKRVVNAWQTAWVGCLENVKMLKYIFQIFSSLKNYKIRSHYEQRVFQQPIVEKITQVILKVLMIIVCLVEKLSEIGGYFFLFSSSLGWWGLFSCHWTDLKTKSGATRNRLKRRFTLKENFNSIYF